MADKKITELPNINGADLVDADEFVVVDISADETKAITLAELKNAFDAGTGFVRVTGDTMTGVLVMPDGTNSAPSIANTGDTNTGMFFGAADTVSFTAGGTKRLDINTTGIDVTGGFTATDGSTITTADNTTQLSLISTDNDAAVGPVLELYRNSGTPANWDSMGRLAFNGEDSAGNKTEYAYIAAYPQTVTSGSEDGYLDFVTMVGATAYSRMSLTNPEVVINESGEDFNFRVESNGNANMLFVDGGGEVVTIGGLSGATSEDAGYFPLQVGNTGSGSTILQMLSAADAACTIHMGDSASGAGRYDGYIQYGHGDRKMLLGTGGATRLTIDSSGNVGIGIANPVLPSGWGRVLHLHSATANGSAIRISDVASGSGDDGLKIGNYAQNSYLNNTDNGFIRFDTNGAECMRIDSSGAVTMPLQPAFSATVNATQSNLAVGSAVRVKLGTVIFDNNADFTVSTGDGQGGDESNLTAQFTAPVTGKYQLNFMVRLQNVDAASAYYIVSIHTSSRLYRFIYDPDFGQDAAYWTTSLSVLADMDASDTAFTSVVQHSGTAQTDVDNAVEYTVFSGYLVA